MARFPCRELLLSLATLLAGCGFHFEGYSSWPSQWPGYQLANQLQGLEGEDFEQLVRTELSRLGVRDAAQPAVQLRLLGLEQRKYISAVDARGQAAQYELQRQLHFSLATPGQPVQEMRVIAQRRLSFDPAVVLAKQLEEAQIVAALSQELVNLMLLRVEATLRQRNPAPQGSRE